MPSLLVDLKDGHIYNGSDQKQDQEDSRDRDVDVDSRYAAKTGSCWSIWSWTSLWRAMIGGLGKTVSEQVVVPGICTLLTCLTSITRPIMWFAESVNGKVMFC